MLHPLFECATEGKVNPCVVAWNFIIVDTIRIGQIYNAEIIEGFTWIQSTHLLFP